MDIPRLCELIDYMLSTILNVRYSSTILNYDTKFDTKYDNKNASSEARGP